VLAVKGFTYMDQTVALQPVDIGRGLSDTITVLRAKARQKDAHLTMDVAPGLPAIQGFGGELNQVWANLIENALDAVAEGGHVSVIASHDDTFVTVRVTDDGTGIPHEMIDRIFEPFFTTKAVGEGTGLGLDIVRRVIHRHNGTVTVSSEPGRTEFTVTLPLGAAAASA
jgi:signal transduction histidine kinase